jgi:phosphate transport system permease protein
MQGRPLAFLPLLTTIPMSTLDRLPPAPPPGHALQHASPFQRAFRHGDTPYQWLITLSALTTLALIAAFGLMLWITSEPARTKAGLSFVTGAEWNPPGDVFGAWPFIIGTVATSLIALAIAVPLGLAIAVFLAELCPPRFRNPLGTLVEMLAAIPSVVYGMWGVFVFIPDVVQPLGEAIQNAALALGLETGIFLGPSLLASGLILAVMILPTISAISRDVLLAVPQSQREASLALGSTQWEMIWKSVLPYGLSGILGATILGLGRAIGETMAVTMTIGNITMLPASILSPGYSMASVIANEWGESATSPLYSGALLGVGLLLFALSLLVNLLARLLVWSVARKNPEQRV